MEYGLRSPEKGAAERARFIRRHVIEAADKAFDDVAGGDAKTALVRNKPGVSA